jgi:branched-chain amino acid aminotransferase
MQSSFPIEVHTSPVSRSAEERAKILSSPLGFGKTFIDHMVTVPYREQAGWLPGTLGPYRPLELDPASAVLHYAQSVFEGFKAFRQVDGSIATFRPEANAERMRRSAQRMAMPEIPTSLFMQAADMLIQQDRDWVPTAKGSSLYVRPLLIATDRFLGVRPSQEYLFLVMASPSDSYFHGGVKPVKVWVCENFVRAAPGGTGAAKFGGNYAAGLLAQVEATARNCAQVVWLDAVHRTHVEEMGGMNVFFVFQEQGHTTLVTPKLTGTLLPGITRDSLLQLGPTLGYEVQERTVTLDEWISESKSGRIVEAFACGTAAVVTPIGAACSERGDWQVGDGQGGPVARQLREHLLAIQYGETPDTMGWMHRVC